MKGFDFDNTIYDGESVFDFAIFVVKREKKLLKYIPVFIWILIKYKMCWMKKEDLLASLEKYSKEFMSNKQSILQLVEEFWEENIDKLYPHMLKKIKEDDVIITTSPKFLMDAIKDVIPTNHVIASEVDLESGKIIHLNFQDNKVKAFQEKYPTTKLVEFYTDSYNDLPMMNLSKKVFLVKKGCCKQIKPKK